MQTLKELLLSQVLQERKNHLINKLDLPEEKKSELVSFFEKHPNMENKIDWNKKNLTWDDFEKVLNFREEKMEQAEKSLKTMSDFEEDYDYQILHGNSKMGMVQPLCHYFQEWLQSNNELGPSAKWCIGTRDDPSRWDEYSEANYFVCFWDTKRKIMGCITKKGGKIAFYDEQDNLRTYEELDPYLKGRIDINDFKNFDFIETTEYPDFYDPDDSMYDEDDY